MLKRIIWICFLIFWMVPNVNAKETVRITNGEWSPYLSKDLKYHGVGSRIVTDAFASVGIEVEYGFFIWQRSFNQAKAGRWDGTLLWTRNAEREKVFYYSDPVIYEQYVFFHLKSFAFDWQSIDDLKGINIGGVVGYNYGIPFNKAEKEGRIKVRRISKDELNLIKLSKGKISIFPHALDVGYYQIKKFFSKADAALFTHHPRPTIATSFHLLLSKKIKTNANRIKLFNEGLKQLQKDKKIEQYYQESRAGRYEKP